MSIAKKFFLNQDFGHGLSVTEVDLCHVISNIKMSSSLLDKPLSTGLHQKVGSGMTGLILVLDVVIFNPEAQNYARRKLCVPIGNKGTRERVQTRGTSSRTTYLDS